MKLSFAFASAWMLGLAALAGAAYAPDFKFCKCEPYEDSNLRGARKDNKPEKGEDLPGKHNGKDDRSLKQGADDTGFDDNSNRGGNDDVLTAPPPTDNKVYNFKAVCPGEDRPDWAQLDLCSKYPGQADFRYCPDVCPKKACEKEGGKCVDSCATNCKDTCDDWRGPGFYKNNKQCKERKPKKNGKKNDKENDKNKNDKNKNDKKKLCEGNKVCCRCNKSS